MRECRRLAMKRRWEGKGGWDRLGRAGDDNGQGQELGGIPSTTGPLAAVDKTPSRAACLTSLSPTPLAGTAGATVLWLLAARTQDGTVSR